MSAMIGLTGGIASGKSTVGKIFVELGAKLVDADQVARSVVEPGSDALREIVGRFGPQVLNPDGSLARKTLGALVFEDEKARRDLEAITHPRIFAASMQLLAEAMAMKPPFVVYEAALLVENGSYKMMQALVVVAAAPEIQAKRVMDRDGLTLEEARARIAAQADVGRKIEAADYVIWNNGSANELREKSEQMFMTITTRFAGGA